jgi:uncharacterized membrane-anchored protein YitT (DUF2179 family)
MDWGPNSPLWAAVFWVNVVVSLILAIVIVRVVRKYEAKRKQLKADMNTPGMKNVRWLFKHRLRDHDIDDGKKSTEQTHTDLN